MGAMPWQELGPWCEDPRESLRCVQADYQAKHHDLRSLIVKSLEAIKGAVELTEAKGDRFGLLAGLRRELAMFESLSREPLPDNADDRIAMLRKLHASSGQGLGNVLDVISVSSEGGVFVSRILGDGELLHLFGTSRPDREAAATVLGRLASKFGRGESVCFPVFGEGGQRVGWWFAGYSVD